MSSGPLLARLHELHAVPLIPEDAGEIKRLPAPFLALLLARGTSERYHHQIPTTNTEASEIHPGWRERLNQP